MSTYPPYKIGLFPSVCHSLAADFEMLMIGRVPLVGKGRHGSRG